MYVRCRAGSTLGTGCTSLAVVPGILTLPELIMALISDDHEIRIPNIIWWFSTFPWFSTSMMMSGSVKVRKRWWFSMFLARPVLRRDRWIVPARESNESEAYHCGGLVTGGGLRTQSCSLLRTSVEFSHESLVALTTAAAAVTAAYVAPHFPLADPACPPLAASPQHHTLKGRSQQL